jgi:hypothetical protein
LVVAPSFLNIFFPISNVFPIAAPIVLRKALGILSFGSPPDFFITGIYMNTKLAIREFHRIGETTQIR